jgi:hypothetical protein
VRAILWLLCAIALGACGAGQRGSFAYDDSAELDVRVSSSHLDGGVRISELTYASPKGVVCRRCVLALPAACVLEGHSTTLAQPRGQYARPVCIALSFEDFFVAGIGFDISGAALVAVGLFTSPRQAASGPTFMGFRGTVRAATDFVDAAFGIVSLALYPASSLPYGRRGRRGQRRCVLGS